MSDSPLCSIPNCPLGLDPHPVHLLEDIEWVGENDLRVGNVIFHDVTFSNSTTTYPDIIHIDWRELYEKEVIHD